MSHYKSNLRDVEFNLFELFERERVLGVGPFAEIDADTARDILSEVDRLAREELASSFVESDRHPPVYDPDTGAVTMTPEFAESFRVWMDSEWWRLQLPPELGGQPAPPSLIWALGEFVLGANPAIWIYGCSPATSHIVWENGVDRDRRIARHIVDRRWTTTMVLTEPDAGSDVGAARAKAYPNADGSWRIEGVKRFITSGDHDLSENIVHLVLARPVGVDGAGGPGTKGLSLFLVPKHRFDIETGELTGERNGVYATDLERKMGIKVSTTCELTFGGEEPAIGWLLGDRHDGIRQMFKIIENARMMVGAKAIATLSSGYLNALEFAKERVQGADLTAPAKTAPRVTITHHPDVRRSLMTQKAFAEGMRSLMLYASVWQDEIALAKAEGRDAGPAEAMNDLLLPIVKGYGSERSWVLLGSESLQTFGGSGFLQDYPIEQYVRDAKIDTLYEGTTAIQGQDLFFRKIVKDGGRALGRLDAEVESFITDGSGHERLKTERELLSEALGEVRALVGSMLGDLSASDPNAEGADVRNVYKVGLNTTRLIYALGDVVVGWLLLRGAETALTRLDAGATGAEKSFYEGKAAAASWFAATVLPKLSAERRIAESTDLAVMDVDESAF